MNLGSEVQHVEIPLLNFETSELDVKVYKFDNPGGKKEEHLEPKCGNEINRCPPN